MEAAAKSNLKRVSLELGGKSPIVVFPDVDRNECLHFYWLWSRHYFALQSTRPWKRATMPFSPTWANAVALERALLFTNRFTMPSSRKPRNWRKSAKSATRSKGSNRVRRFARYRHLVKFHERWELFLQVSERQRTKIIDLIESGKKEGATLKCGGDKWGDKGYFVQTTVFADVKDDMRIAKEEVQN
jgi:aldehyde dehydrogenase (NAD+)